MSKTRDRTVLASARAFVLWAAVGLIAVGMSAMPSAQAGDVADVDVGWDGVGFEPLVDFERLVLTVSGPGNVYLRREFGAGTAPFFEPVDEAGAVLPDGSYNFELRVEPVVSEEAREALAAAREAGTGEAVAAALRAEGLLPAGPLVQTGHFTLKDGTIVGGGGREAAATIDDRDPSGAITNDQVIFDDLIVDGSACVGLDCVNGESFGFDTLRLKENNLRLHFDDTSVSASFPRNDWRIIANDSANGGDSYLAIEDSTAGRQVFRVEAASQANALFVTGNRVGLGTSTPAVELDVLDGDTPTMRLQQDGSSGFTPQTWDVAGNETNFFIRDVTNGSTLPFRIRPGAPGNSLFIDTDGDVGLGTTSPAAALEVVGDLKASDLTVEGSGGTSQILVDENSITVANRVLLRLENSGRPQVELENTDSLVDWVAGMGTSDSYILRQGTTEYRFTPTGRARWFIDGAVNFDMNSNGNLTIAGTLNENSDVNVKRDIEPVDGETMLARVAALPVSTWSYKRDETGARHVGPMAQDFHAAFGLGEDDKHISPRDVAGVALAAVKELQEIVRRKDAQLEQVLQEKNARIAALEARLAALEQWLSKPDQGGME